VGLLLGNRLPERTQQTAMHGLAIVTLVIGFQMALRTHNILIVLFSILIGGVVGEAAGIDDRLNALGRWIESRLTHAPEGNEPTESDNVTPVTQPSISRAFVTSALLVCVGPVAILGSIQDGLLGDRSLLIVKSVLDMFVCVALAASLGAGVILSAVPLFLYQGGLTLGAHFLGNWLGAAPSADAPAIVELTATGGVLVIALGLQMLDLKKIRVANFLPAIALAPAFVALLAYLPTKL
jgi:uncharacterized protein